MKHKKCKKQISCHSFSFLLAQLTKLILILFQILNEFLLEILSVSIFRPQFLKRLLYGAIYFFKIKLSLTKI